MSSNFDSRTSVDLLSRYPVIELNNQGEIYQFNLDQEVHRLGRAEQWADLIVPPTWFVISSYHATLQKEGGKYRIYDGDGNQRSKNGLFINHTRIDSRVGHILENGSQLEIGQDPRNIITLSFYNSDDKNHWIAFNRERRWDLNKSWHWPIKVGRFPEAKSSISLNAPTISRHHATISRDAKNKSLEFDYYVEDESSLNGTFLNGQRITQRTKLDNGNRIQIGPFSLVFREATLEILDQGDYIRLDAHNLSLKVKDNDNQTKVILNEISLPVEPGQLVALVGGSGAGKSTLLKALLGILPLDQGHVFINGDDLKSNFEAYRSQIGYVPQDDAVHKELTVAEELTYSCQLRLAVDADIAQIVHQTLDTVGLSSWRNTFIRDLSGGQRKRVSIAVELLANPKLFFLDEPTSGLDPGLDKSFMDFLRQLSNRGCTVILVTHTTTNIALCDRIAFLAPGGNLCYFGPPHEAVTFFKSGNFPEIYSQLNKGNFTGDKPKNVNQWRDKFIHSEYYTNYITQVLAPSQPENSHRAPNKTLSLFSLAEKLRVFFYTTAILSKRYLRLIKRDFMSLIIALLAAPLLLILIGKSLSGEPLFRLSENSLLTQYGLALKTLFVFACTSIFVGILSSIQEIVKELNVRKREELAGISTLSYISSKCLVRFSLAFIQATLMTLVILQIFELAESTMIPWPAGLWITTYITILASVGLGLLISAVVKNESQASGALVFVMLLQIIFSGALFDLEGLFNGLSWMTISRWAVGAYGTLANINQIVPCQETALGESICPIDLNPAYMQSWNNLTSTWLMILMHLIFYCVFSLLVLMRRNKT